jgi:hypothetical protein
VTSVLGSLKPCLIQEADDILAFKPSRLGHGCYMTDAQVILDARRVHGGLIDAIIF